MIVAAFLFIWVSMISLFYLIHKEQKKNEVSLSGKIETLEEELTVLKSSEPVTESAKRINKMAVELVEIIQCKENDIKALLSEVEKKNKDIEKRKVAEIERLPINKFNETGESLSLSEKHTLEVLRKRRAL